MKKSFLQIAFIAAAALSTAAVGVISAATAPVVSMAKQVAQKASDVLFGHMFKHGLILGMTTMAANNARAYELGSIQEYPVIANDIIYEGAAIGENGAGYARPLVAGDPFLGFAERIADNSTGAAGAANVRARRRGQVQLAVAGAAAITANKGTLVYASDDDTFTVTASTNSPIGRISRWVSAGVAVVEFDAADAAAIAALAVETAARIAGDV